MARELALQDWFFTAYLIVLLSAVVFAATGPERAESIKLVLADCAIFGTGVVLARSGILARDGFAAQLIYRLTFFGVILGSYFQLRVILPAVTSRSIDAQIFAFDLRVFHVEPAVAWDRFVTPQTTEWFAFFYFGYFFVLSAHVLPFMLLAKRTDMIARFSLCIFMVFCSGHLLYMLVPGYGPYHYLAGRFGHELTGGTFLRWVRETVNEAGAQKDIFPSLHTAVPTFLTLFSFKNRKKFLPFRYSWPIVAFITTQIIIATMFLRWHYLIDIIAGLVLAAAAVHFSDKAIAWEERRRKLLGISPILEKLPWGTLTRFGRSAVE